MEPMDGDQGLESGRSPNPDNEGQSTDINAEEPWTFELQPNPEQDRQDNPTVDVQFNTQVEVHALKLQGNTDESPQVRIILSVWDSNTQTYRDVLDSSGNPLVSAADSLIWLS